MDIILEIVFWGSLAVSVFAYGGYTIVGRLLARWHVVRGELS